KKSRDRNLQRQFGVSNTIFFCLSDPDWASHTLGVFICLNCSGIHRNIPQVSKVKSVRLDSWDDVQVEFMAANGNNVAKARYEAKIPPFYYKPTFPDCQCYVVICNTKMLFSVVPKLASYPQDIIFQDRTIKERFYTVLCG
uniref:Arf-GAP domain-containing protein n=1 Tax=Terrapene triunguis TaxID=2587831 RepID=A0A674JLK6_9SAUR